MEEQKSISVRLDSAILGIGQKNHVLMIAQMLRTGSLWKQNGAELGNLKYEK